ncbi:hypothetical protein THAOC_26648, partial [Thalassiosira oceanica]
ATVSGAFIGYLAPHARHMSQGELATGEYQAVCIPWHPTTNPHHRRGLPTSTSSSVDWSSVGPNGAVDVGAPTCRTTGRAASTPDSVAWCSAGPRGPLTLGHRQLEAPKNPRHRRARQPNWAARRVGTSPPTWARGGRIELTQALF